MLLIEADGKALLRSVGIATPEGTVVEQASNVPELTSTGPWIVKAQVPVGGRGKAGGVIRCAAKADVDAALKRLHGAQIKGHSVQRCLVETAVTGADEYYLSLMADPAHYGVRVTLAREGGVDVETAGTIRNRLCAPDAGALSTAIRELAADEPDGRRAALIDTGERLARLFLQRELMLAEINPLFVNASGCIAGDAKIVIDLDAVHRQPELAALIEQGAAIYPDAVRKLRDGFDYVEINPQGDIGLLTTGAGLSMMMIDEMTARGGRPLNFCDIRTGLLRGEPTRLIKVLGWIGAAPNVKVVLVSVFGGVTDLSEFAGLLCDALARVPRMTAPVVARVVGNRAEAARAILAARRPDIAVEEDLDAALGRVDEILCSSSPSFRSPPEQPR